MKHMILVACLFLGACASASAEQTSSDDPTAAAVTTNQLERLEPFDAMQGDPSRRPIYLDAQGREIPEAAYADLPRDAAHPASNRQLVIPSNGFGMNALFLLAAGEGPKPTMLLLHGLPGNERNLDLAQAVRRAGWNVLTFTYRGAWGSQGTFSIQHALEDTKAALAFLRSDAAAREYGIDRSRLVLAGHSMGGYAAAFTAANDLLSAPRADHGPPERWEPLAGLILLDAWPIGETAAQVKAAGAAGRQALIASFDDLGHALGPITAADIADELDRRGGQWALAPLAARLSVTPVLSVYASGGLAAENRAFAAALRKAGAKRVTDVGLESDHAFADKRITLAAEVVRWLEALR
ncbi:alpha/beta fold hydrolase [Sphingomonas parva]|uniref:Alpha/beta fold hydrolase n=1 Tax=Sphingomonas parva TaxID=2555898 RepID=A0A4Y8ZPV4_9SPHN|nr:alpha/beta fold hydrolase [Sphingomonas parva]TFI58041.1 alpha/beta fold hydrolase [Sphingomonas parva]